jgi:hypothetical protein
VQELTPRIWNNLNLTAAGIGGYGAVGCEMAQQFKRKRIVHQKEKQAREYITQLEKKREYIHAWVDEATVDQLTGLIREIARQVLAGPITATSKPDEKKKRPSRPKKSATVLPIRPA